MATSNNVEALSNLSSTAGIDLVALRRKYLAVKENSETSSSHEINRENKFENIDKSAAASLDDYVICKSCLGEEIVQIESLLSSKTREAAELALNLSLPLSKNTNIDNISIDSEPQVIEHSARLFLALSRAYVQLGRLDECEVLVKQRNPVLALQTLEEAMLKFDAHPDSGEQSASVTSAAADCLSLLGKMQLLTSTDRVTARTSLERVLFHYPVDSSERPHELAREALRAAEALHPRIDRRLIGQVYLHYGHLDWAAEQFELAAAAELASQGALSLQEAMSAAANFCGKEFSEIAEWNQVMSPRVTARITRTQQSSKKRRALSIVRSLKSGASLP
eukprot:gene26832-35524_t